MTQPLITLVTTDRFLSQLIALELSDHTVTLRVASDLTAADTAGIRLVDLDSFPTFSLAPSDIALSRSQENERFYAHERRLSVPFPVGTLCALLRRESDAPHARLQLAEGGVLLGGVYIALTATEYALAAALISARGDYVSRAKLASLMSDGASDNALNVYVHYLRRKLEVDGIKVITSSRKDGYRIEPYLLEK